MSTLGICVVVFIALITSFIWLPFVIMIGLLLLGLIAACLECIMKVLCSPFEFILKLCGKKTLYNEDNEALKKLLEDDDDDDDDE